MSKPRIKLRSDALRPTCSYCQTSVSKDSGAKYYYGVPGFKNVVKCSKWWCTRYQKTISKYRLLKQQLSALVEHMKRYG